MMSQFDLKKFLDDQCAVIREYKKKRIEEEGFTCEIDFAHEWIVKYAKQFREDAIKSGKYDC